MFVIKKSFEVFKHQEGKKKEWIDKKLGKLIEYFRIQ